MRAELRREDVAPSRRRELLIEAGGTSTVSSSLVRHRAAELAKLQEELSETRKRVRRKLRELDAQREGSFPPPRLCREHPEGRAAAARSRLRPTVEPRLAPR